MTLPEMTQMLKFDCIRSRGILLELCRKIDIGVRIKSIKGVACFEPRSLKIKLSRRIRRNLTLNKDVVDIFPSVVVITKPICFVVQLTHSVSDLVVQSTDNDLVPNGLMSPADPVNLKADLVSIEQLIEFTRPKAKRPGVAQNE